MSTIRTLAILLALLLCGPLSAQGPLVIRGSSWLTDTHEAKELRVESRGVSIRDYTFRDAVIYIVSTHETEIADCRFINCELTLIDAWDCTVESCQFVQNTAGRVPLTILARERQSNTIRVDRCRFENNAATSLYLGAGVREVTIQDCKFHSLKNGPFISHLFADGVDMLTVRTSKFTSGDQQPRDIGITLRNCGGWQVIGNTWESLRTGLLIEKQTRRGMMITRDNVEPLGRKCREQVRETR
jgi:hypothetical protein